MQCHKFSKCYLHCFHKQQYYHSTECGLIVQHSQQNTFSCSLLTAFRTQPTVPSPPATRTVARTSPRREHHSSAASGGRSAKSTTCAGFRRCRKCDRIMFPSLLPDLRFALIEVIYQYYHNLYYIPTKLFPTKPFIKKTMYCTLKIVCIKLSHGNSTCFIRGRFLCQVVPAKETTCTQVCLHYSLRWHLKLSHGHLLLHPFQLLSFDAI